MNDQETEKQNEDISKLFLERSFNEMRASQKIDQQLVVMKSQYRLLVYLFGIILASFCLWAIFGSIPIKVIAKGIILNETSLKKLQSQVDGTVADILASPGDPVTKGQEIIKLRNPAISIEEEYAENNLKEIQEEFERLVDAVTEERIKRDKSLQDQISAETETRDNEVQIIKLLNDELVIQEGLLKKGLINATEVLSTQQQLLKSKSSLEATKAKIETLNFELSKTYRIENIEEKGAQLRKANENYLLAKLNKSYLNIPSDENYKVVEILTQKDLIVKKGDLVALLEGISSNEALAFYAYVPADEAKRISVGNQAFIQLANFKEEEYGSLKGIVRSISPFPITSHSLFLDLGNQNLADYLTKNGNSVFRIEINLEKDPTTPSGYKWTSANGPNAKITSGSTGNAKLIVEKVRPFYYLLPNWKD